MLFISHRSIEVIERLLNEDFNIFCSWLEDNELIINTKKGKTEYMVFGTSKRLNQLNDPPLNLCYRDISINRNDSYKYLGITVNGSLNMCENFRICLKKASTRVNLLRRVRYFINSHTALTIYKSMIIPTLTYCPLVTSCINNTLLGKVEDLETRVNRIISTNNEDEIPKIATIYKKRCCAYVYKSVKNDVCENFQHYFNIIDGYCGAHNNGISIRLPKVSIEAAKKGFYFFGGKVFNELP